MHMLEIIRQPISTHPRLAVFDFDGTLSLIRCGWQQVMGELIVEELRKTPTQETLTQLRRVAKDYISRSTGSPTIEQMAWLAAAVERRGGAAASPATYKRLFDAAMASRITDRLASVREGVKLPDQLMVPEARTLLDALQQRDIPMALLSGTDRNHVLREASALRIDHYFGERVYGPGAHDPQYSKAGAIAQLLEEFALPGSALVSFGDGPTEAAAVRAVGGIVVGITLDEEHGTRIDRLKRATLIEAGADIIMPHFGEAEQLVSLLWP